MPATPASIPPSISLIGNLDTSKWTAQPLPNYGLASALLPSTPQGLSETDYHILSAPLNTAHPQLGPHATLEIDLLFTPRQRRDRLTKLARLATNPDPELPLLHPLSLRPDVTPQSSPAEETIALAVGLPAESGGPGAQLMATYKLFVTSPDRSFSLLLSAFVPRPHLASARAAVEALARSLRWQPQTAAATTTLGGPAATGVGGREDFTATLHGTRWQHYYSYVSPGAYVGASLRETRNLSFGVGSPPSLSSVFAYDRTCGVSASTHDSCGNLTSDLTSRFDPDHTTGEYRLYATRVGSAAGGVPRQQQEGELLLVLAEDGSLDVKVWTVVRQGADVMLVNGKKYLKQS